MERKKKYGEAVSEIVAPKTVLACAHAHCPEPAITRDALNAPLCKTHWNHAHLVETRVWLDRHKIAPGKESARYQLSKMAKQLANKMQGRGSHDWAYKIKERAENGYQVPLAALDMANGVILKDQMAEAQE